MQIEDVYMGLIISFVLVLALWVLQRFFRKIKVLCLCSTISLMVVVALEVLIYRLPENNTLDSLAVYVWYPGFVVAAIFVKPLIAFDTFSPTYTILSYIFTVIFYSVVFWGIVESILRFRKKLFCRKTN
jgi:hypothetical protein